MPVQLPSRRDQGRAEGFPDRPRRFAQHMLGFCPITIPENRRVTRFPCRGHAAGFHLRAKRTRSPGGAALPLLDGTRNNDPFLVASGFADHFACQRRIAAVASLNIARAGSFPRTARSAGICTTSRGSRRSVPPRQSEGRNSLSRQLPRTAPNSTRFQAARCYNRIEVEPGRG